MEVLLIVWILISIGCLAIDIMTSSFLFVWFSIGAMGAIIAYSLGASLMGQIMIFVILSLICMVIGYPIVKRTIKKTVPKTLTMEESYIGKIMIANQDILTEGRIKIEGIYWGAINEGKTIKQGDKFKIVGIRGNKIMVTNLKEI